MPCHQAEEESLPALLRDVGGQLSSEGVWLAGGLPEDRLLSSLQLDQAAHSVGGTLLGGWREQLDASASQVRHSRWFPSVGMPAH